MRTVATIAELRRDVAAFRARRESPGAGTGGSAVGLVPTMGYLHEGHLALVDRARELTDLIVLSIFVNPTQFGPGEDFERYPRNPARDAELAERRGVEVLFTPSVEEMYPRGQATVKVTPGRSATRLCGASRPGHFEGVLTVVAKLFGIVQPDVAVFGRKDYQQATLIRQMVQDLDMPVRIDVTPTVREGDGLALSSRNTYLSEEERTQARSLSAGLFATQAAFRDGVVDADVLAALVRERLEDAGLDAEYVEVVDPDSLDPVRVAAPETVVAVAARVGTTRLIDNVILGATD